MHNANNRQEFLRMQERAVASAREMQRRATLPAAPAPTPKEAPKPKPRPDGIHHPCPGQQARYQASYGRTQPPIRRQAPPPPRNRQKPSRSAHHDAPHPHEPHNERRSPGHSGNTAADPMQDIFRLLSGLRGGKSSARPADDTPLKDYINGMPEGKAGEEGMDSLLVMVLLMLLKQESADQGLLLALMYIMM